MVPAPRPMTPTLRPGAPACSERIAAPMPEVSRSRWWSVRGTRRHVLLAVHDRAVHQAAQVRSSPGRRTPSPAARRRSCASRRARRAGSGSRRTPRSAATPSSTRRLTNAGTRPSAAQRSAASSAEHDQRDAELVVAAEARAARPPPPAARRARRRARPSGRSGEVRAAPAAGAYELAVAEQAREEQSRQEHPRAAAAGRAYRDRPAPAPSRRAARAGATKAASGTSAVPSKAMMKATR